MLLNRMLFIPDFKTILIGDGRYTENELYYMETDAGIMRPLLFGGLIFAFLRYISLYGILLWPDVQARDGNRKNSLFLDPVNVYCI